MQNRLQIIFLYEANLKMITLQLIELRVVYAKTDI